MVKKRPTTVKTVDRMKLSLLFMAKVKRQIQVDSQVLQINQIKNSPVPGCLKKV